MISIENRQNERLTVTSSISGRGWQLLPRRRHCLLAPRQFFKTATCASLIQNHFFINYLFKHIQPHLQSINMPFFIKGKRKNQAVGSSNKKNSFGKGGSKKVRLGSKKKERDNDKDDDDEELDSELEEEAELQNNFKYSSEEEIEETVQEKRLRIANKYLEEVQKQEQERLETEDVDKETIAQRLREEVLEAQGKLRKNVADLYSHCGENIVLRCKEHSRPLTCLVVSSDNKFIFSASDDFNIVKWSVSDRKKLKVIKRTDEHGHKKKILALAVSSDFQFLASGDKAARLNIWNPTDMSFIHSFAGHKIDITGLVFRKETHQLFRY